MPRRVLIAAATIAVLLSAVAVLPTGAADSRTALGLVSSSGPTGDPGPEVRFLRAVWDWLVSMHVIEPPTPDPLPALPGGSEGTRDPAPTPATATATVPGPSTPSAPTAAPGPPRAPDPVPEPASGPGPAQTVHVSDFGARPGDTTDDGPAIQRALDSLRTGQQLLFAPGVYRHSAVLRATVPGTWISGDATTLLATTEKQSAFQVAADDVTVEKLTFGVVPTSARIPGRQRSKIWVNGHDGVVLRDVTVAGSAAAGIMVDGGASRFRIERAVVRDTRADGIHMTDGAHDGVVEHPTVTGSGDDGVAVVSYLKDTDPCQRISVHSPTVSGQRWGRGLSVVGGRDITYTDVDVENSNGAAVYIAVEGKPWFTRGVANVRVDGGRLVHSNVDPKIDHGAVLVYLGSPDAQISGVTVANLSIEQTRPTAGSNVGVKSPFGAVPTALTFAGLTIDGGPTKDYGGNVPSTTYRTG